MPSTRQIFLVYTLDASKAFEEIARNYDAWEAGPGLWFISWDDSLSRLYHALKRALKPRQSFLVAPLTERPKFKNLSAGSLAWIGARIPK